MVGITILKSIERHEGLYGAATQEHTVDPCT